MENLDKILINDLLKEREELFAKIHECEKVIENILGQPYPGGLPMYPIPSLRKQTKARARKAKKTVHKPIRRLKKGTENAFLVTVETEAGSQQIYQRENRIIQTVINLNLTDYQISKVQTVFFDNQGNPQPVAVLYEREDQTSTYTDSG